MCGVVLLVASGTATAMSHDHHTHSVSPFDQNKELPHHCVLKGHSINNPCPHIVRDSKSADTIAIATDCGGAPYEKQTVPQNTNKQKVFLVNGKPHIQPSRNSLGIVTSDYSLILPRSLFHPPRFI